jgi:hypothetical protein
MLSIVATRVARQGVQAREFPKLSISQAENSSISIQFAKSNGNPVIPLKIVQIKTGDFR